MQSSTSIAATLAEVHGLISEDEARLGQLRAAKALDSMSKAEATELRTVRQRIRDRADEASDLAVALKVAEQFEHSAAGQKRRDDVVETVQRIESIGLAMKHAAALEDAAGLAYEKAIERRAGLLAVLQRQARNVVELVRNGSGSDERFADQVGGLLAAADGGIPQAVAYRVARLAESTRGMVVPADGVHFGAQLTVAAAAGASLNGLLLRLAGVLHSAGIPAPEQGQADTHEHAAQIVAAMTEAAASETV